MIPSAAKNVIALLDHTILSIIIALQFLGCLACIGVLLLFSRYPGADFDVLPLVLFFATGIATVIVLHKQQKKQFWRRLPALLWNALFAGYAIPGRGLNLKSWSSDVLGYYIVCVAIYLGVSAAIGFAAIPTGPEPEGENH